MSEYVWDHIHVRVWNRVDDRVQLFIRGHVLYRVWDRVGGRL